MLHREGIKEQLRVVFPVTPVHTVLVCYHEFPFTAHQGVSRTAEILNTKVLVESDEE